MEMCYDGTLVMPSSYAVMNEEEMTYVEGGAYYENTSTMGSARNMFAILAACSVGEMIAHTIGMACGVPILSMGLAYFTYFTARAVSCHIQLDKWIASSKYDKNSICYISMTTMLGIFITDIDVSLESRLV